jgi:DNA-directed RNA polymerase sigma subunit (sigma70/sigma32)
MQQLISELTGAVVLSDRAVRQLARVKQARREHVQAHGHDPTTRQLAAHTGLSVEQVENLIVAESRPRGLEERIGDPTGDSATFTEMLADPRAEDAYERVPRNLEVAKLPRLFSELNDRERRIVCARFGLDGPEQTLRQLGSDLGVSAERVRQIEERGLGKLRAAADVAA